MKKQFIVVLLLILSVGSFSQSLKTSSNLTREDYLKKSKQQRNIANAIGIPGAVLATAGMIMFLSEFGNGLPGGNGYNKNTSNTGEVLAYCGAGLVLISVPFRWNSKKNKRIAMSLTIKRESTSQLLSYASVGKPMPSMSIRIAL